MVGLQEFDCAQGRFHTLESAPGKFEKINTAPDDLKKAAVGNVSLFDTLKLVDLQVANMGPHYAEMIRAFGSEVLPEVRSRHRS